MSALAKDEKKCFAHLEVSLQDRPKDLENFLPEYPPGDWLCPADRCQPLKRSSFVKLGDQDDLLNSKDLFPPRLKLSFNSALRLNRSQFR